MRAFAICLMAAAAMAAGCLRATAFKCASDADCGASGVCEAVGYCSVPNASCSTGRSYSSSAGQDLSSTCVPPGGVPGLDAGTDAPLGDTMSVGCPSPYAPINGSPHRYKTLSNITWNEAKTMCALTSAAAYLAIPDDATELTNLTSIATVPFWIGIERFTNGTFITSKGDPATFLPLATGQTKPGDDCGDAISTTQIATDRCTTKHDAVCECEP